MKCLVLKGKSGNVIYWMDFFQWKREQLFYNFYSLINTKEYLDKLEQINQEEMEELLKEKLDLLRTELDGIAKLIKESQNISWISGMQNIYVSGLKVELAKAWLGILMKHLGSKTPYVNDGKRHEHKDIDKTTNVSTILEQLKDGVKNVIGRNGDMHIDWTTSNLIEKLDFLREELEVILTDFQTVEGEYRLPNREASIARTEAWKYMVEAKMELGFALQEIKKQADLVASSNTNNEQASSN